MKNTVIVLCGAPGAGKSHFADFICSLYPNSIVCCADDQFIGKDGVYNFDASQLWAAHANCQRKFITALENNEKVVIVCNTNVKARDKKFYLDKGREMGYEVVSIGIEDLGFKNIHSVPEPKIQEMKKSLKESFRF